MRTVYQLENLRKIIDKMSKQQHIEILKILKHYSVVLNENNYGTFVNMSELHDNIINKISEYIEYTDSQESHLKQIEYETITLKDTYFSNELSMT